MNNREFRNDLQEMWLGRFSKSQKSKDLEPVRVVTTSDMIKLTAMFMCGCLILMGAIIGVVAVLA